MHEQDKNSASCACKFRFIVPKTIFTRKVNQPPRPSGSWNLTTSFTGPPPLHKNVLVSALEREDHQDILVVRTLEWEHKHCTLLRPLSEHTQTQMRQCKQFCNIELHFNIIAWINRPHSLWRAQKGRRNCWLQQGKLQGPKTNHGLRVEWRNEVLRYAPSLQNNGLVAVHRADGYRQLCIDAIGWKSLLIERLSLKCIMANTCLRHLTAATFGMHWDGDMTVAGVVAKRWCKGTMHPKVEPPYHKPRRDLLITQVLASAVATPMSLPRAPWCALLHLFPILPQHTKCNIVCEKAELCKRNKQGTNTLSLWDFSWDQENQTL